MNPAYQNLRHQLQLGEDLIAAGVDELYRGWQASATVIGKLYAETDRWRAALQQQVQAPVNLAEILRGRALRWSP